MRFDEKSLLLYAVTDRRWLSGRTLLSQVEEAVGGGATFVQLREKSLDDAAFLAEAEELAAFCRARGVPFVVNDRTDIALAAGADGVHVGQSDMAVCEARRLLGDGRIIGASVRTREEALLAQSQGADYLGVGAVFPTGTKSDAAAVSLDTLREICRAVRIPAVAIGGIREENAESLSGSGVRGIAVVSALFARPDIRRAARNLRAAAEKITAGTSAAQNGRPQDGQSGRGGRES